MNTIPQLFANAIDRFSTRSALLEPADSGAMTTLTYQEVQTRVHAFAGYLQQLNLAKGDRILIWSASRIDWLIAYFAALLVGLVIVPLDVNSKEDFLQRICEVSSARFLITTQKLYQGLKQPPVPLIDIDALPQGTLDTASLPQMSEQDLAQLVFTSGTTGQPKGVMLTHNNIVSNALAALQIVNIISKDRALSILPLSHMFELTIDVAIFSTGASIVYARSLSPETLMRLFVQQHITIMVLVPQALQLFLNAIEREVRRQKKEKQFELLHKIAARLPFALRRYIFTSVHKRFGGKFRFFVSGGAYLSPTMGQRWEEMGFRVLQGYGATECSPVISANPYHSHNLESVGQPLPGIEVKIAEDGEIMVKGPNVAQGYWHNPDATALSFKDGWYYTGDIGTIDNQQNLYLKGRKKNIIVLSNGLNVYPEDVENVLQNNDAVKDVVVVGYSANGGGPEVHAVLLLDDPGQAKGIVQKANKQLASHQQIKGFTIWHDKDFPRTHTLTVKRQEVMEKLPLLQK